MMIWSPLMSSVEVTSSRFKSGWSPGTASTSPAEAGPWLTAIFQSSRDAIIGLDVNDFVTSWNDAAETIFGHAGNDMIGRSIQTIIPPDKIEEETSILDRIRRGQRTAHFETSRRHKN